MEHDNDILLTAISTKDGKIYKIESELFSRYS